MTNLKLLRETIDDSGFKLRYIANSLGLSYQGFLNKLKGLSEFSNSEILTFCKLLRLSEEDMIKIFFTEMVDET